MAIKTEWLGGHSSALLQKREQVGVDPVLKGGRHAVWRAWIMEFLGAPDEAGRFSFRVLDGNNLVVFSVHDQGRDVELLEVLSEIGLREGLDALVSASAMPSIGV